MSRYAAAHKTFNGPGDGRPTAFQILEDEGRIDEMKDKVIVITGCSSGIGIETARALAATGARTFLLVRSLERGRAACGAFLEAGRVELLECDISSLESVRRAATALLARSPALNLLVCNAGVMQIPAREESVDGFESQLATNYLGQFLLFHLLRDALLRGAAASPGFNSRLVHVSSSGHHGAEIQWDDLQLLGPGAYEPLKAYGQSKLAQIYMANYVDQHYGGRGLHALSVMPGGILTGLQKHLSESAKESWMADESAMRWLKSPEQGAATTILAAIGREWEGKGGKYLEDCRVATANPLIPGVMGIKDYTYDESKEDRLWRLTLQVLELED